MENNAINARSLAGIKPYSFLPNILFNALLILFLLGSHPAMAGRCTGSADCTACTTCSSCEYCNSGGGTCGVCGTGTTNAADSGGGWLDGMSENWLQWTVGIGIGGYLLLRFLKK